MSSNMALDEMSPNIKETDSVGRKRSHDEFADDMVKLEHGADTKPQHTVTILPASDSILPPAADEINRSTPQGSPALTAAGSSTPARTPPLPMTPTKLSQSEVNMAPAAQSTDKANPTAAKRKKLTNAEKEAREKEASEKRREREEKLSVKAAEKAKQEEDKAARVKEREEKLSAKAAEKAKQEEEKAARLKEREEKRKKKEEEDKAKAQQRAEKLQKKEEEQRRVQEEKDKKARSQSKLNNFFVATSTPKKSSGSVDNHASPAKRKAVPDAPDSENAYSRMFKPFFLRRHTTMTPPLQNMDEGTKEAKATLLDKAIEGERESEVRQDYIRRREVPKLLGVSGSQRRGRLYYPVKHVMETAYSETANSGNSDADQMNKIIAEARRKLSKVPVKVIAFSRDVRPPYYGTVTFKPYALGQASMRNLARHPDSKLLPLDYDYDSEAEWQEEEGEDVDMDDDEEELDDEDDMEGFLDDSEDAGLTRRIFANAMEPESTGIYFEKRDGAGLNEVLKEHRMEFMHGSVGQDEGIDPWSCEYWETETKTKASSVAQTSDKAAKMAPPPAPSNAFEALNGNATATAAGKLVKAELMNDVKQAILENKDLSKLGIIDIIFKKFRDNASRLEVKNTIECVAEKTGKGRLKEWSLKAGHEITS